MPLNEHTASPLFPTIGKEVEDVDKIQNADEDAQKLVEEIESMCVNCGENVHLICIAWLIVMLQGTTRLLLTKIPYFREVIIMSFSCPHCGMSIYDSTDMRIHECRDTECWTNPSAWCEVCLQSRISRRP